MRRLARFENRETLNWTADQLDADRLVAIEAFRRERVEEPVDSYLKEFEAFEKVVEALLEESANLARLEAAALEILSHRQLREGFRYLAGPPISLDDLQIVADAQSLARKNLTNDPAVVARIVRTIRDVLDQKRFPWVGAGREPTNIERRAAILASAALIATQRVQTTRRNAGKSAQELAVRECLSAVNLKSQVATARNVRGPHQWPDLGSFFGTEVTLVGRKADLIVRLWDGRLMPIECKVSNSALNSVKRLNNDAAAKASGWLSDLGTENVVPVAVLSGVYKRHNLEEAQDRGLMLVWAHRLSDLTGWIESTRPA